MTSTPSLSPNLRGCCDSCEYNENGCKLVGEIPSLARGRDCRDAGISLLVSLLAAMADGDNSMLVSLLTAAGEGVSLLVSLLAVVGKSRS